MFSSEKSVSRVTCTKPRHNIIHISIIKLIRSIPQSLSSPPLLFLSPFLLLLLTILLFLFLHLPTRTFSLQSSLVGGLLQYFPLPLSFYHFGCIQVCENPYLDRKEVELTTITVSEFLLQTREQKHIMYRGIVTVCNQSEPDSTPVSQ